MKSTLAWAALILLQVEMLTASCVKKIVPLSITLPPELYSSKTATDSLPKSIDTDCHITGPIISQGKNYEGVVYFRGDFKLYSITYAEPNTIDSELIGYVCNMPIAFKKPGLRVRFSGNYYHAYKYLQKYHAGESVLYLYLTSIELVKK